MFNLWIYKRQTKLNSSVERVKKDYLEEREKRKETNAKLTQNYRKRVENFVINMLENPLEFTEYRGPHGQQIREEYPEKFKGDAQIYVKGFKHEKDRIKEALERNKDLDFLPNQVVATHQFRARDVSKEIQPDMRFKDKTSLERIEQFLKDHTQTQVENMDFNKNKKAFKFDTLSESMSVWEKRAFIARQIAKNLLPSLHQKTHFQAAQTLYNALPLSINDNTRSLPSLRSQQQLQGSDSVESPDLENNTPLDSQKQMRMPKLKKIMPQSDIQSPDEVVQDGINTKIKTKGDQLETFNPVETSKTVLQNCKIIRKKNPKVKQIHQGEGHLISTLDRSVSEMYQEILKVDISSKVNLKN